MKIGDKQIPDQLFWDYIIAICEMSSCFQFGLSGMMALDSKREMLHDQILDVAKVSRDDKKFQFALAVLVENEISIIEKARGQS